MFEELLGLPAHPLIVHAAVIFGPLLVAAALAYALVPRVRRWIAWAVFGLAVVAPFAVWFATLSGNALRNRLIRQGATGEILIKLDEHRAFGDKALWATIILAVVTVLFMAVKMRWHATGTGPLVVSIGLTVAMIFFAGATAYYVFKTGDSGARVVWGST